MPQARTIRTTATAAVAGLALVLAACGSDGTDDSVVIRPGDSTSSIPSGLTSIGSCAALTRFEIIAPDGPVQTTAGTAYAVERDDGLEVFLLTYPLSPEEALELSMDSEPDDPATVFIRLEGHTGDGPGISPPPTGLYVVETADDGDEVAPGLYLTDVNLQVGDEQVGRGVTNAPSAFTKLDVVEDQKICGTIEHPRVRGSFNAVVLGAES